MIHTWLQSNEKLNIKKSKMFKSVIIIAQIPYQQKANIL